MVLSLKKGEMEERAVWGKEEESVDAIESDLRALGRAAFAEELFATVSTSHNLPFHLENSDPPLFFDILFASCQMKRKEILL